METKNSLTTDKYGRINITSEEGIELLLNGREISHAIFEKDVDVELYNENVEQILDLEHLILHVDLDIPIEEFHSINKAQWRIPKEYENIDILSVLLSKCKNDFEITRAVTEYVMYEERGMLPLLRYLVYFKDYCTKNKHLIGVGRGSSVASFCLYLLGIHKIDSLKYNLDIKEFLK